MNGQDDKQQNRGVQDGVQDDEQLWEALVELFRRADTQGVCNVWGFADDALRLFQNEQLQLVSELEGELPPKKDEHPMEDGVPVEVYGYEAEYNSAIDAVKAVLEHKKQELERGK